MNASPSEEQKAKPVGKKPVGKKSRSPIERIIVWGVILALAAVAIFEYQKRNVYQQHLDVIMQALDRPVAEGPVTYQDIGSELSAEPVITTDMFGGAEADLYTWTWRGLKEYKIELLVGKDSGKLLSLKPKNEGN